MFMYGGLSLVEKGLKCCIGNVDYIKPHLISFVKIETLTLLLIVYKSLFVIHFRFFGGGVSGMFKNGFFTNIQSFTFFLLYIKTCLLLWEIPLVMS